MCCIWAPPKGQIHRGPKSHFQELFSSTCGKLPVGIERGPSFRPLSLWMGNWGMFLSLKYFVFIRLNKNAKVLQLSVCQMKTCQSVWDRTLFFPVPQPWMLLSVSWQSHVTFSIPTFPYSLKTSIEHSPFHFRVLLWNLYRATNWE